MTTNEEIFDSKMEGIPEDLYRDYPAFRQFCLELMFMARQAEREEINNEILDLKGAYESESEYREDAESEISRLRKEIEDLRDDIYEEMKISEKKNRTAYLLLFGIDSRLKKLLEGETE